MSFYECIVKPCKCGIIHYQGKVSYENEVEELAMRFPRFMSGFLYVSYFSMNAAIFPA